MSIKEQPVSWTDFLKRKYESLINSEPTSFKELTPSKIPEASGVYIITGNITILNGFEFRRGLFAKSI